MELSNRIPFDAKPFEKVRLKSKFGLIQLDLIEQYQFPYVMSYPRQNTFVEMCQFTKIPMTCLRSLLTLDIMEGQLRAPINPLDTIVL